MNISDLITADRVTCSDDVTSKKRTLELLGELISSAAPELAPREIVDSLVGRERLGSTGLGHGVALPHGRLSQSDHAVGAFVKLTHGVDFDAIDKQPVDLVFALLVPEHFTDEHLRILAHLAEMFSDKAFCDALRETDTDEALHRHLTRWRSSPSTMS